MERDYLMLCKPQIIFLKDRILNILGIEPSPVFYIGGSDTLPPPLEREEEERAISALEQGDEAARQKLIEHNLRLVVYISKRFENTGINIEDLISIGTIGLIKAVNTFKSGKNIKLATYASRCIENEILMHFRSRKKSAGDVSLSDALDVDGDGSGLSIMDVVAQEDDMAERIGNAELCQELLKSIETSLTKREAKIIRLRYGLDGAAPMTQKETAQLCGISRSYVSRIEKKALEKLRLSLGESD